MIFGVPLALIGLIFYCVEFAALFLAIVRKNKKFEAIVLLLSLGGFGFSLYFVYLQAFVIGALCKYCMGSALISSLYFFVSWSVFGRARRWLMVELISSGYHFVLKPIFFRINPETVHVNMLQTGRVLGRSQVARAAFASVLQSPATQLTQTVAGIKFISPVGLAAGFDYEADLPDVLPALGFGFGTVGTITNRAYGGNPRPMLGRLPKSRSLMVNKGFKNLGATATIKKMRDYDYLYPVGVSIGRTNGKDLTQSKSVSDIVASFVQFEKAKLPFAYYELNISCPNLYGDVSFYPPNNLKKLLAELNKLHIKRPVFVKMPISESDKSQRQMLEVIAHSFPAGVIYGNLQKNRKNPQLIASEVRLWEKGNFSGKPTFDRSNELISLAYKRYNKRFIIIGCGGVFSAADAYEKIKRGATLVQLITGMIFEGPQLISQINLGLAELLQRDGYRELHQAVGSHP